MSARQPTTQALGRHAQITRLRAYDLQSENGSFKREWKKLRELTGKAHPRQGLYFKQQNNTEEMLFFSPQSFLQIWNQIFTCDISLPLHPTPWTQLLYHKRGKTWLQSTRNRIPCVLWYWVYQETEEFIRSSALMLFRERVENVGG